MTPSFWERSCASLPYYVQRRHSAQFEAAERLERAFEITWDTGRYTLALACRLGAITLNVISDLLDAGARRLSLFR